MHSNKTSALNFLILAWLHSLKHSPSTWDIVEYEEIGSIFDLLDDDTRENISKPFGEQIVDSKVKELEWVCDASSPRPFVYKDIRRIETNENLFVTIMGDQDSKTVFSTRIHYIDDETP